MDYSDDFKMLWRIAGAAFLLVVFYVTFFRRQR